VVKLLVVRLEGEVLDEAGGISSRRTLGATANCIASMTPCDKHLHV
jgi:hypothetical protein